MAWLVTLEPEVSAENRSREPPENFPDTVRI